MKRVSLTIFAIIVLTMIFPDVALAHDCSSSYDCANVVRGSGILATLLALILAQTAINSKNQQVGSKITKIRFDGKDVVLVDANGNEIRRYPATSGRDGVKDTSVKGKGPIPEGEYIFDPKDISKAEGVKGWIRKHLGDWGDYRVTLTPDPSTDTKGRDGFFLHGGEKPGSAGCIDVGANDKSLFPMLQNSPGPIRVTVKY